MSRVPKLAGLAEIAAMLAERSGREKVSRSYAGQVTAHPEFPAPVQRLAMGPVWLEADVVKFIETPRKPGRRVPDPRGASAPLRALKRSTTEERS